MTSYTYQCQISSTTGQCENYCLCLCVQLEAQFRSQGISDFQLSWKSDIRRQDEINENPAAESHGPGSEELKLVCSDDSPTELTF